MIPARFDVVALGNALLDVIAPAHESFLIEEGLEKGGMALIDEARADALFARMSDSVKTSGGSAANTVAGVASFGGKSAFIGKVGADALGKSYARDMREMGAAFVASPLQSGAGTGRCLINVTPDGERTMSTFLGAAQHLSEADVDRATIEASPSPIWRATCSTRRRRAARSPRRRPWRTAPVARSPSPSPTPSSWNATARR